MAQLQFRSDDTIKWKEGFGTGSDGDLTTGSANIGGTSGFGIGTFTGTVGNSYGSFTDVAYFNGGDGGRVGDIVLIHETQNAGANNWQLNKIASRSGSTLNLVYPLTNTFSADSQIISSGHHNNITFNGTTGPYMYWDTVRGGITFLVAKKKILISGTFSANERGFNYGNGYAGGQAYTGEAWGGAQVRQATRRENAGGGGFKNGAWWIGGGGGGNGAYGEATYQSLSQGGASAGSASLVTMTFGGGGGGSYADSGTTPGHGGRGGGIIVMMAKEIEVTGILRANGGAGTANNAWPNGGGGGGGAGGSILLKCETATLGSSKVTAAAGAGMKTGDDSTRFGGNGSVGRIHLDYSKSYTGTTSPTLNATQDLTIKGLGGNNFFAFL